MKFDEFVDSVTGFIKWFTQIMTDFIGMFKKDYPNLPTDAAE